jgi:hypothetical protein
MISLERANELQAEWIEDLRGQIRLWRQPVLLASVIVTLLLAAVVQVTWSAWFLLAAGRGFVPETLYPVWGFVVTLGTVFGQAVGWAGGSLVAFYLMTLFGFPANWPTARVAMSLVYLGLAAVPLSAYHLLYGGWLEGMPRVGFEEWLKVNQPDAYRLLTYIHPVVDRLVLPLAIVFLAILWKYGDKLDRHPIYHELLALSLLGTSFAVALSLASHSILVHIRM